MLRRLRTILAHARAGHRIGCETCAQWKGRTEEYRIQRERRPWWEYIREPVVAPAPPVARDGTDATGSRPTRRCATCGRWDIEWDLSIHNPVEMCESGCDAGHHEPDWCDELTSESQKHSDSAGSPVDAARRRGEI